MSNNYEELKQKQIKLIGFNPYNEKECLKAVKQNGLVLQYVINQTEDICLEAVKEGGLVLQYVKEQTKDICMEAVKNGLALQYVKEQTKDICLKAVKEDGFALAYVKDLNMLFETENKDSKELFTRNNLSYESAKRRLMRYFSEEESKKILQDSISNISWCDKNIAIICTNKAYSDYKFTIVANDIV